MTTQARKTIADIVHENDQVEKTEVITQLYERGYELSEATNALQTECEIHDDYVVGLKKNGDETSVDEARVDQKPGEPTGEYFDGKNIVHEDDVEGTPAGLPVLEDVGHPLVRDLGHEYFPREMRGSRTDLEVVVRALADPDYSVLLIGETGVGKNVLLKRIAEVCNWPMKRGNFGVGVDYESLIGRFGPKDTSKSGREMVKQARELADETDVSLFEAVEVLAAQSSSFEFIDGILKQCVENGYMFVGDEINTVGGEVTSTLHGLTEEEGARELVVQDTATVIEPDDRFQFVGTMNPRNYTGTNRLNQAFKTRFYPIQIPYLEPQAEKLVVLEKSHLGEHEHGEAIAETLVELADQLRAQMQGDGGLVTAVSSRDLIKIGNMIADPDGAQFMQPKAATKTIMEGIADPSDWTSISTTIDAMRFQ